MTDSLKAQLEVGVNSAPAEEGFKRVERAGKDMGAAVGKAAESAGKAVDGIGDGADVGAKKMDRATSSIIASVQRTTAAMQAGEKGTAKYFEALADQRGANAEVLKPYIEALRAVEIAQGNVGISARQTAAAMRGVPAQMTDIITSLQGGQAPLTVLLQQGGQLKDMFGGVGNAAKALGGYMVGLLNPITAVVAAIAASGVAYYQGSKEADAYNKALLLSGNSAGTTVGQLGAMAASMSKLGVSQGAAAEALAVFAQNANVGKNNLQEFTLAATRFAGVTGQSVGEVAKQFADLAKDPLAGSLKLNESMNYLSLSVYRSIKALQDQGKTIEAATLAQKAFADAGTDIGKNYQASFGTLERGWNSVAKAISGAWDTIKNIGREAGPEAQLQTMQAGIAVSEKKLKEIGPDSAFAPELERQIEKMRVKESVLQSTVRELKKGVELQAEQAQLVKSQSAWDAIVLKNATDTKRELQEIQQTRSAGLAAGIQQVEIEKQVEAIKSRYAQKNLGGENEVAAIQAKIKATSEYIARLQNLSLESPKLTEAEQQSLKIQQELQGSITGTARAMKEKALATANELIGLEKTAAATELWRERIKKSREEYAQLVLGVGKAADSIAAQADAQEAANAVFGKGTVAIQQMTLAQMKHQLAEAESSDRFTPQYIAALNQKIKAQERFVDSLKAADYKTLNAGLDEWLRSSQEAGKLYADEANLASMTSLERAKVVAQRQVELQLAAKIKDIDKSSVGDLEKDALRQKARDTSMVASAAATAKAVQDEWVKVADQINQSLTDALMRGFESGKGFLQNLVDTAKNMFKTLVLRPIIQAVLAPVSGALAGGMGLSTAANAASASSGLMGLGGLAGAAGLFGSGVSSGLSAWGAGGSVTGLLGQGSALFAGGIANGLGTIAGALGPIALGVAAVYSLVKSIDSSGTYHTGGGAMYSAAGGLQTDATGRFGSGAFAGGVNQQTTDMVSGMAKAVVGILDSTAIAFGKTAGYQAATSFADDSSRDGAWGSLVIKNLGGQLINWNDTRNSRWAPREFADGQAGLKQYTDLIATDVRKLLIAQTPDWADAMLNALGNAPTIEQLGVVVQQINNIQNAFVSFGKAIPQLANLSGAAVQGLLDSFGGVENLSSSLGGYYQAYYTSAERAAQDTSRMSEQMTKLGLSMPNTLTGFRKLVEAQDLTTESGRTTYAALLALSPAFSELTKSAQDSYAAYQQAFSNPKEINASKLSSISTAFDAIGLRVQDGVRKMTIWPFGNRREIDVPNMVAASLPKTIDEYRKLVDAQDQTTAAGKRARAMLIELGPQFAEFVKTQEEAQAAIAQQHQGLQDQLDQLMGNTGALRERERNALDASNRALYDQIQALKDQQTAAQAAADAEKQRQEAIKSGATLALEEARRLRGQTTETASAAFLQAQFAILTGQARSGNATALSKLPDISKALEQAAKLSATSSTEFERVKAALAASLEATVAAITLTNPTAANTSTITAAPAVSLATLVASSGTAAEQQKSLIEEVRALREQVGNLLTTAQATAVSSDKTARTFDLVTQGTGTVMVTTV